MKMNNGYRFRRDGKLYKHHRGFRVRFFPATNTRGERVGIYDMRFRQNDIIPYNYKLNNICEIAIDWLEKSGIKITGFFYNSSTKEYFLTTDSFEMAGKHENFGWESKGEMRSVNVNR
jgi:hypothetical protein